MDHAVMPRPLVIIAAKAHVILTERLQKAGYDILHITPDEDGWEEAVRRATGLIMASGLIIDEIFLSKSVAIQWIARLGSGLELVDMKAAEKRGIKIFSSPEGNSLAVGEHTLGMLLSLLHKIASSNKEIIQGQWIREQNRGTELSGKTVGIIGFEHTGRAFAKVLTGFDVTILAHDKYIFGFGGEHIKEVSKEQILTYCDVISLHLPLTKETYHYANEDFFGMAKNKPIFLNTSRGEVHDTKALTDALANGLISAAGLDVLENEKLSSYTQEEKAVLERLLERKNVLITPHIAGYSHEAFFKMSLVLSEKLGL